MADVTTEGAAPAADAEGTPTPKPDTSGAPEPKAADTGAADDARDAEGTDEGTDDGNEGATEGEKAPAPKPDDAPEPEGTDGDDSEDGDDLDEDDDRLDAKVRRRIREKNRENKRLRERATSAERTLIAYRVAEKSGIPLSLADRLKGSTEDEMAADAADMLALMGRKPRVTPTDLPDDGRSPAGKGTPPSYDDLAESLFNR